MNWIDIAFVLLLAGIIALAAQRRISGFLVGLGGVLLIKPLLMLSAVSAAAAGVTALFLGLILGFWGRNLERRLAPHPQVGSLLGGLGGLVLGVTLVIALAVSLPVEIKADGIVYPPSTLRAPFGQAVTDSEVLSFGKIVLLFPRLDKYLLVEPEDRALLRALHDFFVIGTP